VTQTRILATVCAVISAQTMAFAGHTGTSSPKWGQSAEHATRPATVKHTSPLGNDADGDGVPDTQDACCQTPPDVPVDATGRPLGDFDLDCDVDQADFSVFQRAYTGPLEPCSLEICDNGLDDDDDRFVDCDDFDCLEDPACIGEICDNGIDDDEDTFVDCEDFDCLEHPACIGEICDNGIDDDADTFVDCEDFDCLEHPTCTPEICDNSTDDDGDGFVDCEDYDCLDDPACP